MFDDFEWPSFEFGEFDWGILPGFLILYIVAALANWYTWKNYALYIRIVIVVLLLPITYFITKWISSR
jgi:hypothetical protein